MNTPETTPEITPTMILKAQEVEAAARNAAYAGRKGKAQKTLIRLNNELLALCNNDYALVNAVVLEMCAKW